MQFIFGDKREVHLLDGSVLPVTEKERRKEGKCSIGPKMKYGHRNHESYDVTIVSLMRGLSNKKV